MLRIQTTPSEAGVRVAVHGDLDLSGVPELRARLRQALATYGPGHVEIDLAGVGFLDCAGARSLLWADAHVRERGGRVTFVRPAPPVSRLLRLLGFDSALTLRTASHVPLPQPTAEARPRPD
ncbi:STAS domain-containing protein [Microbispora hainanensis]|jgi:anti-anti-sigma factor|uniref:Anti-sigma factor antagonist n=1 Tax=Microbispora hainanensis TaxID=568844 RepID=A0ABZ1SQ92_9ACTN|nr:MULTISPECIES: STAS domain-containing protein [Microbispora]NJP28232.1 STAS domain-containing protein [Microbispora sp. CL1-1]TQS09242.1 STAS domain-containing protein [Microbispora sp. SCL1-1]